MALKLGKHRWVVERPHEWFAGFGKQRIRFERRLDIHLALLKLAAAIICARFVNRDCVSRSMQSLLRMMSLPWLAPDYSTVCRRQKGLDVQVHYRPSRNGLNLLAESTGIKFLGESDWKIKKHGAERRRQWRKMHLGIDEQTLKIRAIVVTTNEIGDSPVVAELLGQIPGCETAASFTGDGAYDTKDVDEVCHQK